MNLLFRKLRKCPTLLYFLTDSSTFITYDSKIIENFTKGVDFQNGFLKILKNGQWGFEKHSDTFEKKIIHDDFSDFPINHGIGKQTHKPLKDMRKHTKVTAAEIHFPDDEIEF